MSEHSLAYYGNRVIRPSSDPRRDATKRALSWALVALVHLLLLAVLTVSFLQQQQRSGRKGAIETILDLSLLANPNAPPVTLIKPQVQNNAPPEVTSAPIIVTPPKPVPEEDENVPSKPGDVLKAIGQALACGASNFENLTQAQRSRCPHQPWIPRQLPNGTIVMDAPPKEAAPPEIHMSGAEQMRRDMQTAPPCPMMLQTPCVDDILTGRNNKPF